VDGDSGKGVVDDTKTGVGVGEVEFETTTDPMCGGGSKILEYPFGGWKLSGATKKGRRFTLRSIRFESRDERYGSSNLA